MFWKRKTDEEFVEYQRKWLLRSRWIAAGASLVAICLAAISLTVFGRLLDWAGKVGVEFEKGMVFGMFVMLSLVAIGGFCGVALMWFLKPRALRLLVEYHDRLHEKQKQPVVS